ncbi:MAG: crossover junction endodeoxyribonuclease RuvC [Candidatus Marinimicrobia bacterium]|nr:crossover junction endodeoxyribonuclease RuvC [Candidatus Neomarinimicrobiota bacterium]
MRILGIDPSLVQTGFGIISINNNTPELVDYGIIKPNAKENLPNRLLTIFQDVKQIVKDYKPSVFSIEDVFYGKNVKSTLLLGQARGVAIVAGATAEIPIYEYSPRKVKQALTGNGNASKEQVQFMVKASLNMQDLPQPMDASDALAIALCHYQQFRIADL